MEIRKMLGPTDPRSVWNQVAIAQQQVAPVSRVKPPSETSRQEALREDAERPAPGPVPAPLAGRADAVTRSLRQLSDLMATVESALEAAPPGAAGGSFAGRLLDSATATARDVIDYARAEGEPAFRMRPPSGPAAPRLMAALQAYTANQEALPAAGAGETQRLQSALLAAEEGLNGPRGLIRTLERMAKEANRNPGHTLAGIRQLNQGLLAMQEKIDLARQQVPGAGSSISLVA
jgi:hypothetical protein